MGNKENRIKDKKGICMLGILFPTQILEALNKDNSVRCLGMQSVNMVLKVYANLLRRFEERARSSPPAAH